MNIFEAMNLIFGQKQHSRQNYNIMGFSSLWEILNFLTKNDHLSQKSNKISMFELFQRWNTKNHAKNLNWHSFSDLIPQNNKRSKSLKRSTVSDKAAASENLERRNIFFNSFLFGIKFEEKSWNFRQNGQAVNKLQ